MKKFKFNENKFVVVNTKRFNEMNEVTQSIHPAVENFFKALSALNVAYENVMGKPMDHKYIVVNVDEPYSSQVMELIVKGEEAKKSDEFPYIDGEAD